jgi:hypothetical protein
MAIPETIVDELNKEPHLANKTNEDQDSKNEDDVAKDINEKVTKLTAKKTISSNEDEVFENLIHIIQFLK